MLTQLKRYGIDLYTLLLLGTVALAIVLPARGAAAPIVSSVAYYAVALLFFLYGARLKLETVWAGLTDWRLQGLMFGSTYVLFPILALILAWTLGSMIGPELSAGIIFLGILPSTVQSSIAFTGLAKGDVAGAICGATLSNLAGVFITPALAALMLGATGGGFSWQAVGSIAVQILLPFILGMVLRRFIGGWVEKQRMLTLTVDRGSILLIVYSAFGAGVVAGVWQQVPVTALLTIIAVDAVLLAVVVVCLRLAGSWAGLGTPQQTALLFCGATKSLASGLPIAVLLFPSQIVSIVVLPLMLFHQLQLLVFASVAQRRRLQLSEVGLAATP
ncbi:Sodium/bile acid symporter family [Devosia sp. DBB001]|nr:Sodium/bile acid symporter family [Devosia sp. DBB001]